LIDIIRSRLTIDLNFELARFAMNWKCGEMNRNEYFTRRVAVAS
jgi:hypothetical protein